ncbi:MAG: orotidine-5'-phosphate decarboxylase [Blastocatellia bacterium]
MIKTANEMFADRLLNAVDKKQSNVVVGLDPDTQRLPRFLLDKHMTLHGMGLKGFASAVADFNTQIIDAIQDIAVAVKPQIAFYEALGIHGLEALRKTIRYAHSRDLLVIQDAKRGDIGSTAEAYAIAHIGLLPINKRKKVSIFGADAVTVNPLLGSDSIEPFIKRTENNGRGIFVLVKTSNPSSSELQDLETTYNGKRCRVYEVIAELVNRWGEKSMGNRGYSSVGAVVGATFPEQAKLLRELMPQVIFLVPGYGAQGAKVKDIVDCFNKDGYGAVISSSREIIYAYQKLSVSNDLAEKNFAEAARESACKMRDGIRSALA